MSHPLVLGLFDNPAEAAAAARALRSLGLLQQQVSIVAPSHDAEGELAEAAGASPGSELEDSRPASRLGELSAHLLAAVALMLPGIGPIVASCLSASVPDPSLFQGSREFAAYLGLGTAGAMAVTTIYAWNLITHAHFRWDDAVRRHRIFGPAFRAFEHVIASPGIHHSHHGYGKDGGNFRNYAVTFSFLDAIFGTLHIPEGRPWRYGLPGQNAHWSEEVLYPLVRGPAAVKEAVQEA